MCMVLQKLVWDAHRQSNRVRSPPAKSLSPHPKSVPSNCSAHKANYTKVYLLTRSLSELAATVFVNHPLEGFCHGSDFHKKHTRPTTIRRPALQELQIFICKICSFLINPTKNSLKQLVCKYPPTVTWAILLSGKILSSLALEVSSEFLRPDKEDVFPPPPCQDAFGKLAGILIWINLSHCHPSRLLPPLTEMRQHSSTHELPDYIILPWGRRKIWVSSF